MIGSQTGTALGELAREVIGSADVGLPLGPEGTAALLPAGVADFSRGAVRRRRRGPALPRPARGRPPAAVRARAVAAPHLLRAVEQYASGITIDMARLEEASRELDPTNPAALQERPRGRVRAGDHPAQQAALRRLETLLALVEGWVDDRRRRRAPSDRLPGHAGALAETMRRRRADRRARRADLRHPGRPRAAAAPAAGGRRPLAGLTEARGIEARCGASRAATPCGISPTTPTDSTRPERWPKRACR
jgi:uncharacterized protein (DUF2342 family)